MSQNINTVDISNDANLEDYVLVSVNGSLRRVKVANLKELVDSTEDVVVVDTELSTTSMNPIQNKVITAELNKKVNSSDMSTYQTKIDNTLTTTSKEVVGAINENTTSINQLSGGKADKSEVSQLKEDLSDKLPKSPTNWGPWTAEEQAVARDRIGIDKYQEIAVITLEEDSIPVIDLGTEYAKLFIVFKIPDGNTCVGTNYIRNQNRMNIGYFPSNTVFATNAKFATSIISRYGDYWMCDTNYGSNNSASNLGSNRSAFELSDDIVTQLNFSNPIRKGSKISVYGVIA